MFDTTAITDLDGEGVLVFVAEQARARLETEVSIYLAVAHFADVNNGDAVDSRGQVLPGMEQAKRLGGPGTPRVREFAAARLAVQLGVSSTAARYLMADVLDLRHRLPILWGRMAAGEVATWLASKVAKATRHLSVEAAGFVDAALAPVADGRLPFSRFQTVLEAKVIEADLQAAAKAEAEAARSRFARVGRSNEHGVRSMYIRALGRDITWFDAAVARVADALQHFGDNGTEDVRRSRAVGVLANPLEAMQLLQDHADAHPPCEEELDELDAVGEGEPPEAEVPTAFAQPPRFDPSVFRPKAVLYLHIAADTVTRNEDGVVRWEGEGPVTAQHLRDFLGPRCRFSVRPVLDLANLAPVDGYETPGRLREGVHLVSPADVFPFGTNTSRGKDVDHTDPYTGTGQPGQTRIGNLAPMSRFHHRVKTFGHWQARQPFPGIMLWQSPGGEYFLVDNTGTRRVRGPAVDAIPATAPTAC